MKITVTKQALRELVIEALEGGVKEPVEPNPVVDPSAAETDPINPNFTPQNKAEFNVAVKNMVKGIEDDKIPGVYSTVKTAVEADRKKKEQDKTAPKGNEMDTKVEERIRKMIRDVLAEAEDVPGEELDVTSKGKRSWQEIADEVGDAPHNVRRQFKRALMKLQFASGMSKADLQDLVLGAQDDYIELLRSTGELTPADIKLLLDHPEHVSALPGFQQFFDDYIRAAMEEKGLSHSDEEGEVPSDHKPQAKLPGMGKKTFKVYGKRGPAKVHTKVKGQHYVPTTTSRFKTGDQAVVSVLPNSKLRVSSPSSDGEPQIWDPID